MATTAEAPKRKKPAGTSTGTQRKKPTGSGGVRGSDGKLDTRKLANKINTGSTGERVSKKKKEEPETPKEKKEFELWQKLAIISAVEAVILNIPFGLIGIYMAVHDKKYTNKKGTKCRAFRHWMRLTLAGAVIGLAATGAIIAVRSIYM